MAFEWDRQKAAANLRKHGIDFAEQPVSFMTIWRSPFPPGRMAKNGSQLSEAMPAGEFWWSSTHGVAGNIRVISARRATPRERKHYEGGR